MANQALWLKEKGGQLELGPAKDPAPGPNEVVVRNRAVAINPADWKMRDEGLLISQWPTVLGFDIAGEITAVGSNIKDFQVGDRVFGLANIVFENDAKHAAFQLYPVVPAQWVAKLPKAFSFADGSVLPSAISTAADGLYGSRESGRLGLAYPEPGRLPDNGSILVVYGASSSVGAATTQLAVASGSKVIGVASERNFAFVRETGADQVFDYKDAKVVEKVVEAVKQSGRKFVGVYDAIGLEESFKLTVPIVEAFGGNLTTVLPPPQTLPQGVKAVQVYALTNVPAPVWKNFATPALEQGTLKPLPKAHVIGNGLESVSKGIDEVKKGVSAKKIVIEL